MGFGRASCRRGLAGSYFESPACVRGGAAACPALGRTAMRSVPRRYVAGQTVSSLSGGATPGAERVARVVRRIQAVGDPQQIGNAVVEALLEAFAADVAVLYVLRDAHQLACAASTGLLPEEEAEADRLAASGHPHWVARSRRTLLCADATQDPRVLPVGHGLRCHSILCVPLIAPGDQLVGAIEVASRSPYAYHADDALDLENIAVHAARSIGSAARTVAAEERAIRLERISLATQAIAAASGLVEVVERGARITAELFGVAEASVLVLDAEGRIEESAHHGATSAVPFLTDEEAWALLRHPGHHAIGDLSETTGCADLQLRLVAAGVHSLLVVPILRSEHLLGAVVLYAQVGNAAFDREAQEGAAIVAGQIAVAIENARLYGAIMAAQQRTEAVIALTTTGILVVDRRGIIRQVNPAAASILRCSAGELQGRPVDEVLDIPARSISAAAASPPEDHRSRSSLEHRLRTGPMAAETDLLVDVGRLPDGYLVSMTDVTRLKELDRLKTQLLANVSHELRAPLASIKAYAELLSEGLDYDDPALRKHFLAVIGQQTDRGVQTITNLLDLSRVEAEGYRLRIEPCDLRGILTDAIDAVTVRAAERHVSVVSQPAPPDIILRGDRGLLVTMLRNLLDNAVKFSPEGARVMIGASVRGPWIAIAVRDFGIGIPRSERAQLFQKFVRLPSAARISAEGIGLGLVIAYQVAKAHGGEITVHSAVNKGSTFTVRLPARLIEDGEAGRQRRKPALTGGNDVDVEQPSHSDPGGGG